MKFKKSLGQNLLIDKNILKKITSLTSFKNKNVVEIGAGTGNLSSEILKLFPKKLTCIEKDKEFAKNLKIFFKDEKNLSIINDDVLKINFKKLISSETIIIGNLPYNISTQILIKFIKIDPWPPKIIKMIFMFQKEVGEKIIANFGNKNYSRLSIITKSRFKILNYFYVSKNCFIPKPKVDSIVIEFQPLVRKDLKNWASHLLSDEVFKKYGLLKKNDIQLMWKQHQNYQKNWQNSIWNILMLHSWAQEYL